MAARLSPSVQVMRSMRQKAIENPKRVVFGEGEHPKIIRAAYALASEGILVPSTDT